MKKLLLVSLVVVLGLTLLPTPSIAGAPCESPAVGGVCRPACLSEEQSIGQLDCPSGGGPFGNYDCCVPAGGGNECETNYGGECRVYQYGRCPDEFDPTPVGDFGELGCSATRRCCVPAGGAPGGSFLPPTCGECPPGDEAFCAKYPGIQTALGCIPTHPVAFVSQFMNILLFMGGGIAFLLMIVGAGFILTSRGQPDQIQRGKQVFVGALVGLLIIIFSTFLLELIGVDILGLF